MYYLTTVWTAMFYFFLTILIRGDEMREAQAAWECGGRLRLPHFWWLAGQYPLSLSLPREVFSHRMCETPEARGCGCCDWLFVGKSVMIGCVFRWRFLFGFVFDGG